MEPLARLFLDGLSISFQCLVLLFQLQVLQFQGSVLLLQLAVCVALLFVDHKPVSAEYNVVSEKTSEHPDAECRQLAAGTIDLCSRVLQKLFQVFLQLKIHSFAAVANFFKSVSDFASE